MCKLRPDWITRMRIRENVSIKFHFWASKLFVQWITPLDIHRHELNLEKSFWKFPCHFQNKSWFCLLVIPCHQQPWHGQCTIDSSLSSTWKDFYYLCHINHDDVIKWKHFPRYWPFMRGIHRSPVNSRTKASDTELWCFLWSVSE